MALTYVGADIRRIEDRRLITGNGQYVGDLPSAGLLHIAFLRSPHPKARIVRLDTSRAEAAPSVVRVITGKDFAGLPRMPIFRGLPGLKGIDAEVLQTEMVHFVGEPVAAIVAESRQAAEDALDLIDIEYDPLPSVGEAEAAMAPDAPLVHEELGTNISYHVKRKAGDPDAAFARAHGTASVRIRVPRLAHNALEARGILATYDPVLDQLVIYLSTQAPHRSRANIASQLKMPESKIRVIAADVGGGFGGKAQTYREDIVVALAAKLLRRPVRWLADRVEDLQATHQARDTVAYLEAAFDESGKITAMRERIIANSGAFPISPGPMLSLSMAVGAYDIPNWEGEAFGVMTNTVMTVAYRGAARPDGVLFIERLIEEVAHVLGRDPVEVRRHNLIRADQMPYKTVTGVVYDSGDYEATLDLALRIADYEGLRKRQAEQRAAGVLYGVGVCTFVEPSGMQQPESALVRVEPDGNVTAYTGSSPHGQGHVTTFTQIVADKLGVPFEKIALLHGDTASVPPGVGTFGSRSVLTGGSALGIAAERVLEKAKRIAAHQLEAAPEDIQLQDGRFIVAGSPDRSVSWAQVAAAAHALRGTIPAGEELGLEASVFWSPPNSAWGHGTYIAAVRIDPETGFVTMERLIAVDDCGNVINPLLVEGQVIGGIAQGLGQAFLEQMAVDDTGQPLSGTLMDYLLPDFDIAPPLEMGRTVSPSPLNPLGAKGVGEAGAIGAPPAVMNAIVDALRPLGIQQIDFPYSPARVWEAIEAARSSR